MLLPPEDTQVSASAPACTVAVKLTIRQENPPFTETVTVWCPRR